MDAPTSPQKVTADVASRIYPLTTITQRIPVSTLFPNTGPMEIELGSGDGSFLINFARQNAGTNLIGVERLLGRLKKINRKSIRLNLENIRLFRIEAAYFLEWLLPTHCAKALHVYFPDPWPKRKHRKLRLVNERFPELADRVLVPGASIHLRTDHTDYSAQMREVMDADKRFERIETPPHLLSFITDFEAEFLKKGLPIHRWSYRKTGAPTVENQVCKTAKSDA